MYGFLKASSNLQFPGTNCFMYLPLRTECTYRIVHTNQMIIRKYVR